MRVPREKTNSSAPDRRFAFIAVMPVPGAIQEREADL